jgi:alkylation response protein AidB-like acyl-CoA dehydrogenase
MEFGLSEEQTLLQDSVNRFLDSEVALERVRAFAAGPDCSDIWAGLARLGVTGLIVPEAAGGVGLSAFDAALVAEALGNHCAPCAFLGSAVLTPIALTRTGNADDPLLGELAAGTTTVGVALGEAVGARADAGITGDGETLQGKALYVHDFDANHYLVADTQRRLYLVAANARGLTRQTLSTIDKTRISGALTFEATPARCLTSDPELVATIIDIGRVMLAADSLGAAQNMLEQAVAYAKQREQFNRPIASFQAVKHMCAEMAAGLEPCRAMVWYAAHAVDQAPDELRVVACQTKAHVSEVAKFVAKTATEVHGGMGFTDLLGLHYWFKRIGYNRQLLGAPEIVRELAATAQGL